MFWHPQGIAHPAPHSLSGLPEGSHKSPQMPSKSSQEEHQILTKAANPEVDRRLPYALHRKNGTVPAVRRLAGQLARTHHGNGQQKSVFPHFRISVFPTFHIA
jgi:hypothetical protein